MAGHDKAGALWLPFADDGEHGKQDRFRRAEQVGLSELPFCSEASLAPLRAAHLWNVHELCDGAAIARQLQRLPIGEIAYVFSGIDREPYRHVRAPCCLKGWLGG